MEGIKYIFDEVHFERKTKVKGSSRSNMDVVLISDNKETVLFLECKFSEYLKLKKENISVNVYCDIYNELNMFYKGTLSNMVAKCIDGNNKYFELVPNDKINNQYCEGIKQMISHYMGIKNFIKKMEEKGDLEFENNEKKEKKIIGKCFKKLDMKPEKILFGEVLFKFPDEMYVHEFENYKQAYKKLAVAINKHSKEYINGNKNKDNEIFRMLPEILTYDQIFKDYELPKRIKELYQLK